MLNRSSSQNEQLIMADVVFSLIVGLSPSEVNSVRINLHRI
jgi:hypothetical protein